MEMTFYLREQIFFFPFREQIFNTLERFISRQVYANPVLFLCIHWE